MFLLYKFVKSCLETAHNVLTLLPSAQNIVKDTRLTLLWQFYVESSRNLFFHQNTLIQYDSSLSVVLFLLENRATQKLPLPKIGVIRHDFRGILEQCIIDGIGITLLKTGLKLLYSFFEILRRLKLEIQLPLVPYLIDHLIVLWVWFLEF